MGEVVIGIWANKENTIICYIGIWANRRCFEDNSDRNMGE
jgi:hypothetical protein